MDVPYTRKTAFNTALWCVMIASWPVNCSGILSGGCHMLHVRVWVKEEEKGNNDDGPHTHLLQPHLAE